MRVMVKMAGMAMGEHCLPIPYENLPQLSTLGEIKNLMWWIRRKDSSQAGRRTFPKAQGYGSAVTPAWPIGIYASENRGGRVYIYCRSWPMRVLSKIAITLLTCVLSFPLAAWAQGARAQGIEIIEHDLFDYANHERSAQGLPPLKWDNALARAAQKHAIVMAQQGTLSHQFPGESSLPSRAALSGVRYVWLAENVAEGPSAQVIHAQWVKSPNHRANLLDPDMDSIGIAVAERNGTWFAVEDFSKAKP